MTPKDKTPSPGSIAEVSWRPEIDGMTPLDLLLKLRAHLCDCRPIKLHSPSYYDIDAMVQREQAKQSRESQENTKGNTEEDNNVVPD